MLTGFADTSWIGYLPIKNINYKFTLYISPNKEILNISFPQCGQKHMPIEVFHFVNNSLFVSIKHIGEDYDIVFCLQQNEKVLIGLLFEYDNNPVDFEMYYMSNYSKDKPVYQFWPKINDLIHKLAMNYVMDFSVLKNIKYPNTNNGYYISLRYIYGLNNFLLMKSSIEDKAIALTKWVNKSIRQSGMIVLPLRRDALSLLTYSVQNKNPLNCKGCSIILTDLLLSIGVMARSVHCMSSELLDVESHYITEFYSEKENKWIVMDPAFGCFFESKGNLLGLSEIRDKLASSKDFRILSSINVEKKKYKNKIIYGMCKNFYKFEYYSDYKPGYANPFMNTKMFLIEPKGVVK